MPVWSAACNKSADSDVVLILGAGSEVSIERSQVDASLEGIVAANVQQVATLAGQPVVSGEIYYNGSVGIHPDEKESSGVAWCHTHVDVGASPSTLDQRPCAGTR